MLSPLTNQEGNALIKKHLKNNDIINVGRVGFLEIVSTYHYDTGQKIPENYLGELQKTAGVYGNCVDEFCNIYIESIKTADIHAIWETSGIVSESQEYILNKYNKNAVKILNKSVEPFYFDTPWSAELKDKKVLVINPFAKSFKEQYLKREKIWSNIEVLPKMKLTLYKNIQSAGGAGPHNNWVESLNYMKEEISKLDFDIALLGCGAYGMPLSSFIKTILNKTSIYIGGGIQILFGVIGNRWLDSRQAAGKYFNEHWIRPSPEERPPAFYTIEGGCYW